MSGADPVAVHLHAVLEYSETLRELLAESGEQLEECRETAAVGRGVEQGGMAAHGLVMIDGGS